MGERHGLSCVVVGLQVDYASFSPADMRLNNSVFQWHFRMPEIFEEHKKIVNANRLQYENSLKVGVSCLTFLE